MSKFKNGDQVVAISPPDGNRGLVGIEGVVVEVKGYDDRLTVHVKFGNQLSWWCEEGSLDFKNSIKIKNMSLKDSFRSAFKSEPEKSLQKTGITNSADELTSDGQTVFLGWMLKKYGADFKKEVVDPILAEQEKSKN